MSGKFLARASALSLALFLAACGGGDDGTPLSGVGGSSSPGSGNPTPTDPDSPDNGNPDEPGGVSVGALQLRASPVQMGTNAGAEATVVAFAKDQDNILLAGIPIEFSVDNDAALRQKTVETDELGQAINYVTSPANTQNRVAIVTARAGGQEAVVAISISGTTLNLEGPASISRGDEASFYATLQDSSSRGIALEQIAIDNVNSANVPRWGTDITSDDGRVSFSYQANAVGTDTITVTAFSGSHAITASRDVTISDSTFKLSQPSESELPIGTPATLTLQWEENGTPISGEEVNFFSSRGTITSPTAVTTDGAGEATVIITSPTAGPAVVEARAVDPATGKEITTQRQFEFIATAPASITLQPDRTQLEAKEAARITAVVRDSDGNLVKNQTVSFAIAADVSSGSLYPPSAVTNSLGRASTTFTAGDSPTGRDAVEISSAVAGLSETVALTVSGGASRLTIGTGNELNEPDSDHYAKDWVVFVSDVNGSPVPGVEVELSVLPVSYGKGEFVPADTDGDGTADIWEPVRQVTCPSEDINRNGFLDPDEVDVNGNGKLDPTNEAIVFSALEETDLDGSKHFEIMYPQSSCAWTDVLIEARANVDGTEYSESAVVTLACASEDLLDLQVTPPSFNGGSKYGKTADCTTTE